VTCDPWPGPASTSRDIIQVGGDVTHSGHDRDTTPS